MSALAEQYEHYQGVRERLWGKPQPAQVMHPIPVSMPEPEPAPPPAIVPQPRTRTILAPLASEDDEVLWRDGVKRILLAYGENQRRLVSHQRDRHIMECRYAVASYLRHRGWSYPRIGQVMNRDHSSIVHLLNPQKRQETYQTKRAAELAAGMHESGKESVAGEIPWVSMEDRSPVETVP